jgi:protein-S-isoprenylcysteine O-methyltransferase Ste14
MDISRLTLAAACGLDAYLTLRCFTPPNPNQEQPDVEDHGGFYVNPWLLNWRRGIAIVLPLYHAVLVCMHPAKLTWLCPHPQNVAQDQLLTWSPYMIACLAAVCLVGAPLRLYAIRSLGINFTFVLKKPSTLTTNGLYKYIQHPSYTGQFFVLLANSAAFLRLDGVIGCWMSPWLHHVLSGWGGLAFSLLCVVVVLGIRHRVRDEEKMLKDEFGQPWVRWHRSTKRFIPGLL